MIYSAPPRYADAHLERNIFSDELKPVVEYLRLFKIEAKQNEDKSWGLYFSTDSPKNNLILTGGVGVGKTFLIHAFMRYLQENFGNKLLGNKDKNGNWNWSQYPIPVEYFRFKEIIDGIHQDWNNKTDGNFIHQIKNVPLIIIDEIGISYGTEAERNESFELFNYRWEQMLPMILISNLSPSAKKEGGDSMGKYLGLRNLDRICDGAIIVDIPSATRRKHTENWTCK